MILSRLFFRLLPVQVSMVAMGSINSIVDGIVAARFAGAAAVGVIGLYFSMVRILEASGSIVLGGVSVFSGRYLGGGKIDRTRGILTLGMAIELVIGGLLTLVSLAAPGAVADLLGANEALRAPLIDYIRGYAIGILPQLVGQQLAASLQLERQERRGQIGINVMMIANVALDILFVVVMDLGIWGLALATSLANWAYFLVMAQYYFTKKVQLMPSARLIDPGEIVPILRTGLPNALLVACLALRGLGINRILLRYAGSDGVSALSAFNMVNGLILAIAIGAGSLVRMLASVYLGEENRESLLALIRLALTRVMAIVLAVGAAVIALAPLLARVFFPDTASEVYRLTRQLFFIYGFSVPLALMCIVYSNYFQAAGHRVFANLISVTDGLFSMLIPAMLLAPRLGAVGVWLSFPIGMLITLAVSLAYPCFRLKRRPRGLDEWFLVPPDFGAGAHLAITLRSMEDVTRTAQQVQAFCDAQGLSPRTGGRAGLCLEELAGNIVRHGFRADARVHVIEVRVVLRDGVVLRIKDDCIPFNPREWYDMTAVEDPTRNVSIRLAFGLAQDISYQSLLGLNVLTITMAGQTEAEYA